MDTALSPVSDAIVALHSRFIVERVWCNEPGRLLDRFLEAADSTRASLPISDRTYFDLRIAVIRAELFRGCWSVQADARADTAV